MSRATPLLVAILLLVPGAAVSRAAAGPRTLAFDRWGIEEGLPQGSITSIAQTPDGYVWFATFGGLVRFDGVRFRTYVPANEPGMGSPRLLALGIDSDGELLVGGEEGGVLRFVHGRLELLVPESALPGSQVRAFLADPRGGTWVATTGGVARIVGGRVFERYGREEGLPGSDAYSLALDRDGTLWVGTSEGLATISGGRVDDLTRRDPELGRLVLALSFDRDGALWILHPNLLRRIGNGGTSFARPRDGLPDFAGALALDPEGAIWAGASELLRGGPGGFESVASAAALGAQNVRALHFDREGGLWVGTDGGGVYRLRAARARTLTVDDGVPEGSVATVIQAPDGAIWTGTLCGGIAHTVPGGSDERFVPFVDDGARRACVDALLFDREGALWVGDQAVRRIARGDVRRYGLAEGLPEGGIRAFLEDRNGTLWVGTDQGLARGEGSPAERFEVLDERDGLVDRRVRVLLEGRDGSLWIGTVGGLSRLRDGRFQNLRAGDELPRTSVRALHEDARGTLWIGTYGGGLARLRDGRIAVATTAHGLADDVVSSLVDDGAGSFWMSGNRGLSRLAVAELEALLDGEAKTVAPLLLRARDGLLSAEFNGGSQPSGWRATDGRLWFPSVGGLVVVDPRDIEPNRTAPPVVIEEVRIGGEAVDPGAAIEVRPRRGDVEIRYTALSFSDPAGVRFRYRLNGFDAGWIEAGARRVAGYTNVPPGRYEFQVLAANSDGVWNQLGATLPVVFRPRFVQTGWFYALLALALVLLGAAAQYVRLRRAQARERDLARLVGERTAALAAAHRRAEAHLEHMHRQDESLQSLNRNLARLVDERTEELVETRDAAILTLARLAELRDGTTGEHLERIAAYTRRLAQAIASGPYGRLDQEWIEEIARSSQLHDIGKVAIPDSILNKPGQLTDGERAVMRTHTTVGGDTLRSVIERYETQGHLAVAAEIAYCHHERWDGRGYPRGIHELAIPLAARLVALVDVFDALTSVRPYKSALPHDDAVAIIAAERGEHFDPLLVDAFLRVHAEFPEIRARIAA